MYIFMSMFMMFDFAERLIIILLIVVPLNAEYAFHVYIIRRQIKKLVICPQTGKISVYILSTHKPGKGHGPSHEY